MGWFEEMALNDMPARVNPKSQACRNCSPLVGAIRPGEGKPQSLIPLILTSVFLVLLTTICVLSEKRK